MFGRAKGIDALLDVEPISTGDGDVSMEGKRRDAAGGHCLAHLYILMPASPLQINVERSCLWSEPTLSSNSSAQISYHAHNPVGQASGINSHRMYSDPALPDTNVSAVRVEAPLALPDNAVVRALMKVWTADMRERQILATYNRQNGHCLGQTKDSCVSRSI